jgi:hypothetical protein
MSFRRKYKITLEEEEKIAQKIESILHELADAQKHEIVLGKIETIFGQELTCDDSITFYYRQDVGVGLILAMLGEMRGKSKKK